MKPVEDSNDSKNMFQKCAWCGSLGSWSIALGQSIPCIVCHGTGQVLVARPFAVCPQCRGTGRSNAASPCLVCAGTGWEGVLSQ